MVIGSIKDFSYLVSYGSGLGVDEVVFISWEYKDMVERVLVGGCRVCGGVSIGGSIYGYERVCSDCLDMGMRWVLMFNKMVLYGFDVRRMWGELAVLLMGGYDMLKSRAMRRRHRQYFMFLYLLGLYSVGGVKKYIVEEIRLLVNDVFRWVMVCIGNSGMFRLLVRDMFNFYRMLLSDSNRRRYLREFGSFDESRDSLVVDGVGVLVKNKRDRGYIDENWRFIKGVSEVNGEGVEILGSLHGFI